MPRLDRDSWERIRAEREAGGSFGELARKYRVSKAAIVRRAKLESWADGRDIGDVLRRKVTEKLTGLLPAVDPKKRAAAIDAAAEKRAALIRKHQEETNTARERLESGLRAHRTAASKDEKLLAFEDLKAAKISAEALAIIQKLERVNWGLEEATPQPQIIIERSYGAGCCKGAPKQDKDEPEG